MATRLRKCITRLHAATSARCRADCACVSCLQGGTLVCRVDLQGLNISTRVVAAEFSHVSHTSSAESCAGIFTYCYCLYNISMFRLHLSVFVVQVYLLHGVLCNVISYSEQQSSANEVVERPHSWLQSAQDVMSSPAGHVVVQVAKELLNRSAGNSQVLSLNLTNLLIIILLKILIFSAGMLGAGHWSGYGSARSSARSDDEEYNMGLHEDEAYLITGFLAAQGAGIDDCLYAAACASPTVAYAYAKAARALLEGIEKFEGHTENKPRYNDLIVLMEQAAYDGYRGIHCNTSLKCDALL